MAVLVLVLAGVVLTGCRGDAGPGPSPDVGGSVPGRDVLSLEVYGDSLTVADSPSLAEGRTGPESWVHHLGEHGLALAGGSGRWGATAGEVLEGHLQPPAAADLLVLFLGTNDLAGAGPAGGTGLERQHESFISTLEQIVERQGYAPEHVAVVAVGPRDWASPEPVAQWNRLTARSARDHGWHLVDPWSGLRADGNRYRDGTLTTDGLHLSEDGARRLAEGMATALRGVAGVAGAAGNPTGTA